MSEEETTGACVCDADENMSSVEPIVYPHSSICFVITGRTIMTQGDAKPEVETIRKVSTASGNGAEIVKFDSRWANRPKLEETTFRRVSSEPGDEGETSQQVDSWLCHLRTPHGDVSDGHVSVSTKGVLLPEKAWCLPTPQGRARLGCRRYCSNPANQLPEAY